MVNDGGASVRVKLSGWGVGGRQQPELWAEVTLDHYALGISLSVFFLSKVLFSSSRKMEKTHW